MKMRTGKILSTVVGFGSVFAGITVGNKVAQVTDSTAAGVVAGTATSAVISGVGVSVIANATVPNTVTENKDIAKAKEILQEMEKKIDIEGAMDNQEFREGIATAADLIMKGMDEIK